MSQSPNSQTRKFDTGASRDTDAGKLDFEGALSPRVLRRYVEFLHSKRPMPDGTVRDSDNWQKGMPRDVYMKSAWRHFMAFWENHRQQPADEDLEEAICATIFNLMGYLHEHLKEKNTSAVRKFLKEFPETVPIETMFSGICPGPSIEELDKLR